MPLPVGLSRDGKGRGIRTPDLSVPNAVLYQLSHTLRLVAGDRFERPLFALSSKLERELKLVSRRSIAQTSL